MVPVPIPLSGEKIVCVRVCVCAHAHVLISRVFPSINAIATVLVSTDTEKKTKKKILLYWLQWQERSLTQRDKA